MGACVATNQHSEESFDSRLQHTKQSQNQPFQAIAPTQLLKNRFITCSYINDFSNNQICPDVLLDLIAAYIGIHIRKFDLCPNQYINDIKRDGLLIIRKPHFTHRTDGYRRPRNSNFYLYGSSNPLEPNTGVQIWSIRIRSLNDYGIYPDVIGIVSDSKYFERDDIEISELTSTYCYCITLNRVNSNKQSVKKRHREANSDLIYCHRSCYRVHGGLNIKANDVITVVLDTDHGKLYFKKNQQRIWAEDTNSFRKRNEAESVKMNINYYPFVGSGNVNNEYELTGNV